MGGGEPEKSPFMDKKSPPHGEKVPHDERVFQQMNKGAKCPHIAK